MLELSFHTNMNAFMELNSLRWDATIIPCTPFSLSSRQCGYFECESSNFILRALHFLQPYPFEAFVVNNHCKLFTLHAFLQHFFMSSW
jgi:hypothetical protein